MAGRFREGLLYRLNMVEVVIPPLRERPEHILPLAKAFASSFARKAPRPVPQFPLATRKMLVNWPWPGNVRELRDAIKRALIHAPTGALLPDEFPPRIALQPTAAAVPGGAFILEEIEREHVLRVLAWAPTLTEASRILGVDVTTLWRRRKKWVR